MKTLADYLKTPPAAERASVAEGAKRKITALQTVCWKADRRAKPRLLSQITARLKLAKSWMCIGQNIGGKIIPK